jgi:ABC-2 type transport system permease protein/lipopolysaccharide transport system permease protein
MAEDERSGLPDAPPPALRYRRALEIRKSTRELLHARHIVLGLVVRQVRAQYSQQVLGLAWAVLAPLAQMVVFTFLLNRIGGTAFATGGVWRPLFLYVGLTCWSFFSSSVTSAGSSLVSNPLLNKVYAPREVFPLAQVASSGVDAIASAALIPLLFLGAHRWPSPTMYWVPLLVLILIVFTVAVSIGISAVTVYVRDLRSGLPLLMQLGLFLTPILYPVSKLPARYREITMLLNPVAGVVEGLRACLFYDRAPNAEYTLVAGLASCCYLVGAFLLFKRLETGFADVS